MVRHLTQISELVVHRFRNLKNLNLKELGQFNIFVGRNNTGKTSLLEAIDFYCHPLDIKQFSLISRARDNNFLRPGRLPLLDSIAWMFPINTNSTTVAIERDSIYISGVSGGTINKNIATYSEMESIEPSPRSNYKTRFNKVEENSTEEARACKITLTYNKSRDSLFNEPELKKDFVITEYRPIFQLIDEKFPAIATTKLITPIDHRVLPISAKSISRSILSGDKHKIVNLLRLFDPNIKGIEIVSPDGRNSVPYFVHEKYGFVPITVFGDGLRRVLTYASGLMQCQDGILLVDELETAVHASALDKVFTWLINACIQFNIQLFATTHSLEAIDAIIAAGCEKGLLKKFVTYRLETKANTSFAKRFSGESLHELRYELGQDVR